MHINFLFAIVTGVLFNTIIVLAKSRVQTNQHTNSVILYIETTLINYLTIINIMHAYNCIHMQFKVSFSASCVQTTPYRDPPTGH